MKKLFLTILLFTSLEIILLLTPNLSHAQYQENLPVGTNASATILPRLEHYQFDFTPDDGYGNNFPQDKTITYTITYGASSSAYFSTSGTTIVADYSNVDVKSNTPLVEYVAGSATSGFRQTLPIVDTLNRTITWNIDSLPAGTVDQIVKFQLKTTNYHAQPIGIGFTIKAKLSNEFVTFPEKTISQTYLWKEPPPEPTSTPMPQAAPTPVITPIPLYFNDISLRELVQNAATIDITTSKPSTVTINYGTTSKALNQQIKDLPFHNNHIVILDNLTPDTQYYFTVTAISGNRSYTTSEIYTFRTAIVSEPPKVNPQTITFASTNVFLYTPSLSTTLKQLLPRIVLPQRLPYDFRFQVDGVDKVKKIEAVVRSRFVLGISSDQPFEANANVNELLRIDNGIFQGRLNGPQDPGLYEMYARIYDLNGNITEQKIAELHISPPLLVLDHKTHEPIEAAQVYMTYLNTFTHRFEEFSQQYLPVKNPDYTTRQGVLVIALPEGTYKAAVTTVGYEQKQVIFSLGQDQSQGFPVITLEPKPFDLLIAITYYTGIAIDVFKNTRIFVRQMADSNRFFELNSLIITSIFVLLTLAAFSTRLKIPLHSLISYFKHLRRLRSRLWNARKIQGLVSDIDSEKVLVNADIFVMDAQTQRVLQHIKTDKTGYFHCLVLTQTYTLEILAQGYKPEFFSPSDKNIDGFDTFTCELEKEEKPPTLPQNFLLGATKVFSLLFESLLLVSFVSEIFFGYTFGFQQVWLLLMVSLLNLLFWIIHITHKGIEYK